MSKSGFKAFRMNCELCEHFPGFVSKILQTILYSKSTTLIFRNLKDTDISPVSVDIDLDCTVGTMLGKKLAQKRKGSGFLRSLLKNNLFSGPFNGVKHNT